MSNLFIDWAVDQAVDKAMEKAEDLKAQGKILNDDEIDALTSEEFDKIMNDYDDKCPICGCEESGCDEIGCRSDEWEDEGD